MEGIFKNGYQKYFWWNEGLIDYFLSDFSGREIKLYVDENVLAKVAGNQHIPVNDENYRDDFTMCVETFCNYYNRYLYSCKKKSPYSADDVSERENDKYCTIKECKNYSFKKHCVRMCDRSDVLAVAQHICSKSISYYKKDSPNSVRRGEDGRAILQRMPFFAIVIYIILKLDNGETQQWSNIGSNISEQYVKDLWESISSYNQFFNKDASVYIRTEDQNEDYIGRVKYHILLSSSIRRKLNDAIYKTSIWKFTNTMSFAEQKRRLLNSNRDIADYFSNRQIDNSVYDSKLQTIIEDFNVEDYLDKLEERKRSNEFKQTRNNDEHFTLAISYPERNEPGGPSIRLLTTLHQEMSSDRYYISECISGSLDGYNIHFVKYNDSYDVIIEEHHLRNDEYNIKCLPVNDVLYFYEYHETLYIQTQELNKSNRYIILVRDNERSINDFGNWAQESGNNHLIQYPKETTKKIFGDDWIVYYSNRPINDSRPVNQHDDMIEVNNNDLDTIQFGGGIKNQDRKFFIQALPYIEIPERYGDIDNVGIRIKIHDGDRNYECKDYDKRVINGRRLIIDLNNVQSITNQMSCAITLIFPEEEVDLPCIGICGQDIIYDQDQLYKYDSYGRIVDDDNYVYAGNRFSEKDSKPVHRAIIESHLEINNDVPESLYLVNLVSACCYDSPTLEITKDLFEKCLNYATSRIGGKELDTKDAIQMLSKAGYINLNSSNSKIQIIPPCFSKVPRSTDGYNQLFVLSGGYTKKFVVDLFEFCRYRNIKIYQRQNEISYDGLFPPTILLSHNFSPYVFRQQYNHQFDVRMYEDVPLSLLMSSPIAESVYESFAFNEIDDVSCLNLKETWDRKFPRIRKDNNRHNVHYYIEKKNKLFAEVEKSLLPWAFLYCYSMRNSILAVMGEYHIYLPEWYVRNSQYHSRLILPIALQRSLWMMNLGAPITVKAFVCDCNNPSFYIEMNKYYLGGDARSGTLISKLGNKVQKRVKTTFKIYFWSTKPELDINEKKYLVLMNEGSEWVAIGDDSHVFIKWNGVFHRVEGGMNEIFSFLIKNKWQVTEKGLMKNSNGRWSVYRKITKETLPMLDHTQFNIEPLTIL